MPDTTNASSKRRDRAKGLRRPVPLWLEAVSLGALATALAAVPFLRLLIMPGVFLSAPIFPQGIHTGAGAGTSLLVTIVALNVAFYAAGAFFLLRAHRAKRAAGTSSNAGATGA